MESNESQQMDMNYQFPIISILEHLNPLDNQSLISLGKKSKLKQGQQNQIHTQSIFDSLDLDIPSCYQRPAREDWTKQEQILFFKFLAQYMIQNPECFLSWSKANKKGVFSKMQAKIKTRDKVQCRLKYNSYKRKHSDKSQKSWYINCMRTLIIRKLKQHMDEDEECQQILKKIELQNTNKKNKNEAQTGVDIRKNRPAPDSDQYIQSTLQRHEKSRIKKQRNIPFQDIYFEDIQFKKTHDQISEYVDKVFKDHEKQKSFFACDRQVFKKRVSDESLGVKIDGVKYG